MAYEAWTAAGALLVALGTIGVGVAASKPSPKAAGKNASKAETPAAGPHAETAPRPERSDGAAPATPPAPLEREDQEPRGWRDRVNLIGMGLSIVGAVILALVAIHALTRL